MPDLISGILALFTLTMGPLKMDGRILGAISYAIGCIVQTIIGIFLIGKSRKLAEFWLISKRTTLGAFVCWTALKRSDKLAFIT